MNTTLGRWALPGQAEPGLPSMPPQGADAMRPLTALSPPRPRLFDHGEAFAPARGGV